MVEDAINQITEEKYGIHLNLTYVTMGNWQQQSNLLFTSDEADAVSYTHLIERSRIFVVSYPYYQTMRDCACDKDLRKKVSPSQAAGRGLKQLSLIHIDVYKRQVYGNTWRMEEEKWKILKTVRL